MRVFLGDKGSIRDGGKQRVPIFKRSGGADYVKGSGECDRGTQHPYGPMINCEAKFGVREGRGGRQKGTPIREKDHKKKGDAEKGSVDNPQRDRR